MCSTPIPRLPTLAVTLLLTAGALWPAARARAAGIPNVRVSSDRYAAHGQPSLAINPRDSRNLLGAAMAIGNGELVEETFASFDGGRTWHDNGPLPLPSGVSFGGDPSVAFDAHGAGYVASLGSSGSGDGVYVWRTGDGGRTFHMPVAVEQGQPADHPWLAVDTSSERGGGDLYVAWATRDVAGLGYAGGLAFSRSTNAGQSFTAPRIISAPASGVSIPALAAGPGGAVSIAYTTVRSKHLGSGATTKPSASSAGNGEEVRVISSQDHGQTFSRPEVVAPATTLLAAVPGVNLTSQPSVAIDPRHGSVYVVYSGYRTAAARADILLARSRDGGHAWGVPIRVTDESRTGDTLYFQSHVVVDDAGTVDVTFFALTRGRVDLLLARLPASAAAIGTPRRITSRPFDPALGWIGQKTGSWWIGDYQGLAAGGGLIHPFWNDTRSGQLEIYTAAIADAGG
jgi:hypothetical protein